MKHTAPSSLTSSVFRWAFAGPVGAFAWMAVVLGAASSLAPAPAAWAAEGTTLERPTFDRERLSVVVPFRGTAPRVTTESVDGGTRLVVEFANSQARVATAYKLGVFHPLLAKVEMAPEPTADRVVLTILTNAPARASAVTDARAGVIRLQLRESDGADTAGDGFPAASVPAASPAPRNTPRPWGNAPTPKPAAQPGPLEPQVGLDPLTPTPPSIAPYAPPSAAPIGYAGNNPAPPLPGTPASGDYVYRKAVPAPNGRDVTEIEVRTGRKATVDVRQDGSSDALTVNVSGDRSVGPGEKGFGGEPIFGLPPLKEQTYRPVVAIDGHLGFTLMSENSTRVGNTNLGTNFSGQGATLWGLAGNVPVGNEVNVNFLAESFAYTIQSLQVPDAQNRRDEYFGRIVAEWLPQRRPWVFAFGPGYWLRYVSAKTNVLPPPTPSLLFSPTQIMHGPSVGALVFYPLWNGLGLTAEGGGAPYLMSGNDTVANMIGPTYGYELNAGLKWSSRHVAVNVGYQHIGMGNYAGGYSFSRGGPEVSLVWRF